MEWTIACRNALVPLLQQAGIDAVPVDAIYHADVYESRADLAVVLHYDGVGGTGRKQYAMAAAVVSGQSDDSADAVAARFVQGWYDVYLPRFGFDSGPITSGMTGYYGGWYRTHDTPMALIEHCIGADGGGIRSDRPSPEDAAAVDAQAITAFFNLATAPALPTDPNQLYVPNGQPNGANIGMPVPLWNRWHYLDTLGLALPQIGFPTDEYRIINGRKVQKCERGWLAEGTGNDPWDVVMLLLSEYPAEA
jgi:hypothetical protein